ncbi:MAG: sigma-70 family RNA polymerase sigma factor [Thermoleophilaceae bacterium]
MTLPPLQTVLELHGEPLARFVRASVGPGEADDCIQETLLAALRAYPSLRSPASLSGWLFAIARNKAHDSHRARARLPVPVASPDLGPAAATDEPDEELWAAVRRLPEKQRAAVALRYVADLSHAEIGVALDCSEDAARRSVHEGLKKLRGEWR